MQFKRIAVGAVAVVALAGLAACGSGTSSAGAAATTKAAPATSAAAAAPFGAACSAVPTTGAGSFTGMAQVPVATAASANPVLSTLVAAVKAAGLVDTLNNAKGITVFAPDNAAFAKIPPATLQSVLANKDMLTKILTYHVIGQQVTPAELGSGDFTTLQGGAVTTSGSGENFQVGGANVVCGNVHTANATVYIIDTVLMPKA
ncbi:MAG TPA: fasciclin domain-containing protein [Pseudonocardiaceae bacterium]